MTSAPRSENCFSINLAYILISIILLSLLYLIPIPPPKSRVSILNPDFF